MTDTSIGKRLKEARMKKKLTQEQAANKIGIDKYQTLSAYETGVNYPPLDRLKKLSILYEVSTDWILFGEEKKTFSTPKDYLCQIITAVDELGLVLKSEDRDFNFTEYSFSTYRDTAYLIDLGRFTPQCKPFLEQWYNLKSIYDKSIISYDLYSMGMKSILDNLPNNLNQSQNTGDEDELPF